MTDTPLGGLLAAPPPELSDAEAARLARDVFGVEGRMKRLTSERDLNIHIATPSQGYVLKLANPAEPPEVTDFQTKALLHLEGAGLPVPRVIRTLSGATEARGPQGILRLLTYLEGMPLHLVAPSGLLRASMAAMNARITRALQGFDHPAADHVLQWDIKQAGSLRPMLPAIADMNPHNVLVTADGDGIAGVLDFGDMVRTPLVCDLAVTASYQIDPADALGSLTGFVAAYHAVLPLTAEEIALVPALVAARMLTTLAITSTRAARYPENAPYILRNFPSARDGLLALSALDATETRTALQRACGME
jgi:hydroxylysine kinase